MHHVTPSGEPGIGKSRIVEGDDGSGGSVEEGVGAGG